MTIFIGGNSHTGALRKAQKRDPDLFPDIHIGPFGSGEFESTAFARTEDGLVRFTVDAYRARLIEISGADIFQPGDTWVVMMGTHTARLLAPAFWSNAAQLNAGVGAKHSDSFTSYPATAIHSAAYRAKSFDKNRRSYPTITVLLPLSP